MELLNSINSIQALVILVALHFLKEVGVFAFNLLKNDKKKSEQINEELRVEVIKLRKDLRRFYWAIKLIAGERWDDVSKQIQEDKEFL